MKRTTVNSSLIASIGYDEQQKVLEVEFAEGHELYHYFKVPIQEFIKIMDMSETKDSVGKYFNTVFKEKYRYQKIT